MSKPASKSKPGPPAALARSSQIAAQSSKPATAARLRVQTRKLLAKHYRAKYGVR